jgi:hypothetical protein
MKMKKLLLSIALVSFLGFAYAGNDNAKENKAEPSPANVVSISGTVADLNTGEALTGVEITIEGTDIKTYSDFDGNFSFDKISPGEYSIIASFISYKKSLVEDYQADGKSSVNIKLQAD